MKTFETKEFGTINFCWNNVPEGALLLRDDNGSVMLEVHLDSVGEAVDVVAMIEKHRLTNKDDFRECLVEARKYQPDLTVPIYIKTLWAKDEEDEEARKIRLEEIKRMVKECQKHPWNPTI